MQLVPTLVTSAPRRTAPKFDCYHGASVGGAEVNKFDAVEPGAKIVYFWDKLTSTELVEGTCRRQHDLAPLLFISVPSRVAPSLNSECGAARFGVDLANFGAMFPWRRKLDKDNEKSRICSAMSPMAPWSSRSVPSLFGAEIVDFRDEITSN
jgi:hypothetical protein